MSRSKENIPRIAVIVGALTGLIGAVAALGATGSGSDDSGVALGVVIGLALLLVALGVAVGLMLRARRGPGQ